MASTKNDIKNFLVSELKSFCDNVETQFIHPLEYAEQNSKFPYITIIFGKAEINENSKMAMQGISIIGFAKDDQNTISEKIDEIEDKIIKAIYRKSGVVITEIDNNNIFKPFGLDAGVYPPFGAVRIEIKVARTIMP